MLDVRRRIGLASAAAVLIMLAGSASAAPTTLSISPNATLPSGHSRAIAAVWGDQAPYNVDFRCNVPGCADFVSSSTSVKSLSRTVSRTTCTGVTSTHTITVRDTGGNPISGSSRTTWNAGVCF